MKPYVVQKFGGTSVGISERLSSIVEIVRKTSCDFKPIVVVSAVSGTAKSSGTTSLLLQAAQAATSRDSYDSCIENIFSQHESLIDAVLPGKSGTEIKDRIREELDKAKNFLHAVSVIGEASPRSVDVVASLGERMSAMVVAETLTRNGIAAQVCDFSSVMLQYEEFAEDGSMQPGNFYDALSVLFRDTVMKLDATVPVVTGFFGPFPGGLLQRVGRGYSDLTAALLARGFGKEKVKELQVWKEVDGVFSADPRKVPAAKVLTEISAIEAVELTFFGSEVIHPYTMEQVISVGIPIRVLNSLKPEGVGTVILPFGGTGSTAPTAVTAKRGVAMLSVTSNRMYDAKGFLATLFKILHDHDLVVDLVSTSEVTVSCTVNDAKKLRRALPTLEHLGTVEIDEDRAILAVVGEGLKNHRCAVGDIFSALGASEIPAEMITQAASRTSISCVIPESEVERAVGVVHHALFEKAV
jgi:aspartate kinase